MQIDPGQLCQIEIHVSDLAKAQNFYAQAFGWTASPAELHEMVILDVPRACAFGVSLVLLRSLEATSGAASDQSRDQSARPGRDSVVLYFAVTDCSAIIRQVEAAGGRRRSGPVLLPGYGQVYHCEDLDGTVWGLFQQEAAPSPSPEATPSWKS